MLCLHSLHSLSATSVNTFKRISSALLNLCLLFLSIICIVKLEYNNVKLQPVFVSLMDVNLITYFKKMRMNVLLYSRQHCFSHWRNQKLLVHYFSGVIYIFKLFILVAHIKYKHHKQINVYYFYFIYINKIIIIQVNR